MKAIAAAGGVAWERSRRRLTCAVGGEDGGGTRAMLLVGGRCSTCKCGQRRSQWGLRCVEPARVRSVFPRLNSQSGHSINIRYDITNTRK